MEEQPGTKTDHDRIILGLLASVEREAAQTQRGLAQEFGVALGLVNAYLKYCIKKGHIRVNKIPSRRYLYFLTPRGFAEKSRLSLELMSHSLLSFRQARREYHEAFARMRATGLDRVALVGHSELSEIAILCAMDNGVTVIGVVDASAVPCTFASIPVVNDFAEIADVDLAVLTDLRTPQATYERTVARFGNGRVIAPAILGIREVPVS
jgi:DNA-binding MarR family transcriptional regulator